MEKNLTSSSVFKTIIYFALPYLLSYFLQTLYGMADLFIIGQFGGVDGITAVANGSQVMHMLTVIIVGLAMGAMVTIGRAVGAKKLDDAAAAIGNTITLFMMVAVVITVLLVASVSPIVTLIGTPQEAIAGTGWYLTICFLGIPFITAYNIISSIFRGLGDSKSPMYFIAVACAANIALDYLFIGGMGLGAAGAALGTTLAQTFSVCVALVAIRKRETGIHLKKQDFRPSREVMGQILKIGLPVAVGIVEKVISAIFIVPSSMLATVSALSAQNIGAGKHERAAQTLRYATIITGSYGLIVTGVVLFGAESVLRWFTADATVILLGSQYIRGYIWDSIFAGVHFSFTGYFCAYGRSYIGFIHNILAIVLVRVPGSYLASRYFPDTLLPMGLAAPAGSLLSVIICLDAYLWMKKRGLLQNGG